MARRNMPMNEVVETIYQWHKGMKIQHISQSLGIDRKTVRKYLGMERSMGIGQGSAYSDEPGHPRRSRQATLVVSYVTSFFSFVSMLRFFFLMDSPFRVIRCALCTSLSRRASAIVGSPIISCQCSTGN